MPHWHGGLCQFELLGPQTGVHGGPDELELCFLVDLPIRSVRRYLNRWGFKPWRPLKRAFEQRPEAVKRLLETDYPAIAARAKTEGTEIYWGDETVVLFVEH